MQRTMAIVLLALALDAVMAIPQPQQQPQQQTYAIDADHLPEDDSDMLMEPNDFQPAAVAAAFGEPQSAASRHEYYGDDDDDEFRPALVDPVDYEPTPRHRISLTTTAHQQQRPSGVRHRKPIPYDITTPSAQSFLPSFFRDTVPPPLGHSRPYFAAPIPHQQQQQQQPHLANSIGVRSVTQQSLTSSSSPAYDQAILGSGDFGVIRGGTFYQENDPPVRSALESNDYYHFYKNNGHGRPQTAAYTGNGFGGASPYSSEEQFSNFRDFADINAPSDPAYSQFVVVYANKNASEVAAAAGDSAAPDANAADVQPAAVPRRPQNIFEQLEMLDREQSQAERYEVKIAKPLKPTSFKAKLAKTKLQKKYQKKAAFGPKDHDYEPLMALS